MHQKFLNVQGLKDILHSYTVYKYGHLVCLSAILCSCKQICVFIKVFVGICLQSLLHK